MMPSEDCSDVLSPLGMTSAELVVGQVYFSVSYVDDACCKPIVDSLVYIGKDIGGEVSGALYFQDLESFHHAGSVIDKPNNDATVIETEAEPPPNLFDLRGVLDELARCAARRDR